MIIKHPVGTIVDDDITMFAKQGVLIAQHFKAENVKQACYELRASNIFWETAALRVNKRLDVGGGCYVLRPGTYVTAITLEHLLIPDDVIARILTKGKLFSIGILPVNTYADPGFEGRLGLTMYNCSRRYIEIRPGQSIAKIEFAALAKPVRHPYKGQHGYETEIWPIPVELYASMRSLKAQNILPGDVEETALTYGEPVADLERRLAFYSKWVWVEIGVTALLLSGILALHDQLSTWVSFLVGVASNIATHFVIFAIERRKARPMNAQIPE